MSTMMPPGVMPPGLDVGGGNTPAPPPDPGLLMALLGGGAQGGAPPGPDGGPSDGGGQGADDSQPMSAVEHIQAAMKHLMMAMTQSQDEQQGHGITKGMAMLQGLLAGDAKNKATVAAAGGGG